MSTENTYTWEFPSLQTLTQYEGVENVVYVAHWTLTATTGSYQAQRYGSQQIAPYVSGSQFIPFNELTKATMSIWVMDAMGTASYNLLTESLDNAIYNLIYPTTQTLSPPWGP